MGAEHPIDDLFKRVLDEHAVTPPPYVWAGVNERMQEQEKQRRRLWWLGWSAASLIVLAFGAGYWLASWQYEGKKSSVTKWLQADKPATNYDGFNESVVSGMPNKNKAFALSNQMVAARKKSIKSNPHSGLIAHVNSDKLSAAVQQIVPPNESTGGQQQLHQKTTIAEEARMQLPNLITDFTALANTSISKKPQIALNSVKAVWQTTPKWGVEAFFMPVLTFKNTRYNQDDYTPLFGADEDLEEQRAFGYAAGISMNRLFGKHVLVRSGIQYQEFSQFTRRDQLQTVPLNQVPVTETALSVFTVSGPISGVLVNPNLSSIEGEEPTINIEQQTGDSLHRVYQHFGTIEVPVSVGYRFQKNKWGFTGEWGLTMGILVKNEVEAAFQNRTIRVGETQAIQSFQLSGQLSFTADYAFTKSWYSFLAPTLQYSITDWSSNPAFSFRPIRLGARFGVGYRF